MTSDSAGGVGVHAHTLAAALRARGHRVTLAIAGPRPSQLSAGELALAAPLEWESERDPRALQHAVEAGRERLAEFAARHAVDVLHCNQFAWTGSVPGVPSLLAVHSDVVSWWWSVHGHAPPSTAFTHWYRRLAEQALQRAAVVVTPTEAAATTLRCSFAWTGAIEVVPNGWEPATAASIPATADRQGAICAGRLWDECKQVELLMRPDLPCTVVLAGDPGTRRWPPQPRLRLLGALPPAALWQHYANSRVYVACSRYEPFGLAPLEAAWAGCCLLLNDIPSLREVWGTAAFYFARDDGDDLMAWLRLLHQDEALARAGAAAAACRARQLGSADMSAAYATLYRRVAASGVV